MSNSKTLLPKIKLNYIKIVLLLVGLFAFHCNQRKFDNLVDPEVKLEAPGELSIQVLSDTVISLSWNHSLKNEVGFCIDRSEEENSYSRIGEVPVGITAFNDTTFFKRNVNYSYRVYAVIADKKGDIAVGTTKFLLPAPNELKLVPLSETQIQLTWKDNSSFETGFVIERKTKGGSFSELTRTGSDQIVHVDASVDTSDENYTYRIYAYSRYLTSDFSDEKHISWIKKLLGTPLTLAGHSGRVNSVDFSPDGAMLASGSADSTIKLWDVVTGNLVSTLSAHSNIVNSVKFSPDGLLLASGSDDGTAKLFEISTGVVFKTLSGGGPWQIKTVAFSPDGSLLAYAGYWDKNVLIYKVGTGVLFRAFKFNTRWWVQNVAFSPNNGALLACGDWGDAILELWDVSTGTMLRTWRGVSGGIFSFSPHGDLIASQSWVSTDTWTSTIQLWDVATGMSLRTMTGHSGDVTSVAFSPDGSTLVSGGTDDIIKLWDVTSGILFNEITLHSQGVNSVAFSPDGNWLASGNGDASVKLLKMTGQWFSTP